MMRCFFIFLVSAASFCQQNSGPQADAYFSLVSGATRYSPLDGAGAHGGLNMQLGTGFSRVESKEASSFVSEQTGQESSESSLSAGRVYLLKGVIYPLDIGFSAGALSGGKAIVLGGHAQLTIFEGFRLPAFALRTSYASTKGLKSSDVSTIGAEFVASYGFWNYFSLYSSLGITATKASLITATDSYYRDDKVNFLSFGLHTQLLPGLLVGVLEGQKLGEQRQVLGKLAYGI